MKLGQNGIVSFPIRLAVFQASGAARMKLHLTNAEVGMWPPARRGHRGLRPGGNAAGWRRCALSFFKIDRIHHFDTCPPEEDSTFMIRYLSAFGGFAFSKFLFRSDWTLAASWRLYETSSEH